MNTPSPVSPSPSCLSPPCATDSAPLQSQQLLALNTSNTQVAALFNELPAPIPATSDNSPATHTLESIRQHQQSYLAQLEQFWTRPHAVTADRPAQQWLALTLAMQLRIEAQLPSADGAPDDRQLIDQVLSHPTRAQRENALPVLPEVYRPGVYDIACQSDLLSDAMPWPGAFVITQRDGAVLQGSDPDPRHFKGKTAVEINSDLGRVILYTLEYGLEPFDSLKRLHMTLQARIGQKISPRFTTGNDRNENLFARQVQALRNAQQRQVNAAFAEHPADTPDALLARIVAAADLRDVLDISTRVRRRSQGLQYRTWQQTFKGGSTQDWKRYRTLARQVQAGRLALTAVRRVASVERAQALRDTWQYANAASMKLAALEATLHGRIDAHHQQWIQAVLDYPDPSTRPTIGAHPIIANALGVRAHPQDTRSTVQIISGSVFAITSSDPSDPSVVLYTPDSPDSHDIAQLTQLRDIDQRFLKTPWTDYFAARLAKSKDATLQWLTPGNGNHFQLIPIPGDLQQGLYEIQRDALLEQASHTLPGKTESDRQALFEQWMFSQVAGQKNAGLISTFLPGNDWPARIRATGQTDTLPQPDSQPASRQIGTTATAGEKPSGPPARAVRLRLLGGAPLPPAPSRRLPAAAGLVRLGSWNSRVTDIVPAIMPDLPDWPRDSSLVIIDISTPGIGWSVRYRRGLSEDTYGYRVNPDMFSNRRDVVLYRSASNHYSVRLNGGLLDIPAGDDSFFHAMALSLNQSHGSIRFTVERLRNAVAEQIERNPRIAQFVTSAHLPLYTRALEHCMELGIWLGDDVYRELIAILKGSPNPHGLFQPAIRYLDATWPSDSTRLGNAIDEAFNAVHQDYRLPRLPVEIHRIITGYIDAAPHPSLFLLADEPSRRVLFETLLNGTSQAADIHFLVEHTYILDRDIRHLMLEYGATATQLHQYAEQYAGNQITARRDLLRAVLGRFPALLERLDIIFGSPALTPPIGEGLNVSQIAHLLRDRQISTDRLRLITRCADAGIAPINLFSNAEWLKSLSDDVINRLLECRQPLQALAEQVGLHDIRSILFPFDPSPVLWNHHQFQSASLANSRLRLLLDTPRLFTLLEARSSRVAANMWKQLTSATHDDARIRHVLSDPRATLRSLRQLQRALSADLPSRAQGAGTSTAMARSQPPYLRGYELGGLRPPLTGPDERGLHYGPDGKTYILHAGRYYEVRRIGGSLQIVHPVLGLTRSAYEVARGADGFWVLVDIPGLGGDVRSAYPSIAEQSRAQRDEFATLGQGVEQEWQRLGSVPGQVPDLHTLEPNASGYTMEFLGAHETPRQRLTLEKASALAGLSSRIRQTIGTVHQHFEFDNGQLLPRPGVTHHQVVHSLAQLDGLNSLNSGFALLLLNSGKRYSLSAELAHAVQVQFYTQLAQVVMGVATDAKTLAQAIYLGLKDAGHLGSETISLLDKAGRGLTLGGKTLTLGALLVAGNALLVLASLGVDSYLLAHAETAEDKAAYGTNMGLDSLALGTVLAGFAEGAECLGPLSIPLAGLGLGASSLVSVFFAKAHKVLASGEQFAQEIQAYRSGYIERPETHALCTSGPVVVSHLDQRNGQVYLGSPRIYAVDNSRSGDPRMIMDEREALDIGLLLELPGQMALPVSDSISALHLPVTPEHTYLPQYGWLVAATQRNDAELQLFKALEQKARGRFIESEWVAVFQKIVEQLLPRYHPTRIRVSLGQKAPPLVMDDLGEAGEYLSYDIEGQGSQYDLYLSDGPRVQLSSCITSRPSTWVLHTDNLSRPDDIRLEAGRLTLGGVVVQVEDKETLYTVNKTDEAYRVDLAHGLRTLVTLSARDYESVSALRQRLQTLHEQQHLGAPVHLEDLWVSDYPGCGIYYRPGDRSFVAIPVDGEDHGEELYQIPVQPEALMIAPSAQREKVREAAATLATITADLDTQYRIFSGQAAGFWSAPPAAGRPDNEKLYGDFLRAQYRLEVQRAHLRRSYCDAAYPMMVQLLPSPERDRSIQGARQVPVHRLNINGYPSDDVLIIGDPHQGLLLLYVPESEPALVESSGVSGLKACVQQLAADDATRQALQEHFPRRRRTSNHSALWGYMGTDEALENLGANGNWSLIQIDRSPIDDDDVFAALASLKRQSEGG